MRYRKLDPNGDYSFGHSLSDFYIDQIECVQQSILTRLQLLQGSWFLNTQDGVPWNTKVLGKSSAKTRDQVIKSVILGTLGVTEITPNTYSATLLNRQLSINCTVQCIYTTQPVPVQAVV